MRGLSEGSAVVDAMVAILILSMAIILSLRAAKQADLVADRAREIRQANILLIELMAEGPRSFQVSTGVSGEFSWSAQTQITGSDRPIEVCRRVVNILDQKSTKQYSAASFEICPAAVS